MKNSRFFILEKNESLLFEYKIFYTNLLEYNSI